MSEGKYQFKQAVKIERQIFPLGVHQVPAEYQKHPHFQFFLKGGSIVKADTPATGLKAQKLSDLPVLPPPSTAAAKRSQVAAKAVQEAEAAGVSPDAEIGGDEAADAAPVVSGDDAGADASDESDAKGHSKKKKGK